MFIKKDLEADEPIDKFLTSTKGEINYNNKVKQSDFCLSSGTYV
jgi:hypothetical protein